MELRARVILLLKYRKKGVHMAALYAILLGILQGITQFLPVSSFGHTSLIENLLGIGHEGGILFDTLLHVGTLGAVFSVFHRDLRKIWIELVGMIMDAVGNAYLFIHNKRTGDSLHYAKIVKGTYRRLTALLLVSFIPTAMIGYTARRLVEQTALSPVVPGVFLLLTGVWLLVVDLSKAGGTRTPKDCGYEHAMWIGICQGLSVFPGLSRCGLTVGTALFCGFSRKFAVKYSFLVSIPAIIGAFFVEVPKFASAGMNVGTGAVYILGMAAAGVTGYFMIRFFLRLTQTAPFRYFAFYCFLAGIAGLAVNFG